MFNKIAKAIDDKSYVKQALACVLLLLPLFLCIAYIYCFAVEVVIYDEWKFILFANAVKNNPFSADLYDLQAHVDHVLLFTHFIMLIIGFLSRFSFIADMWGSVFFLSCITALLLRLAWRIFRGHKKSVLALLPLPWITYSLRQWENFLMGYQICMFLVCLLFIMCVLLLSCSTRVGKHLVGAILCATLASITFGAGLLAWPLGFIQLFMQNYLRWQVSNKNSVSKFAAFLRYQRTLFIWILCGVLAGLAYRCGYCPGQYNDNFGRALCANWIDIPAYFLASFGNAFAADITTNKIFAAAVLFLFLWTVFLLKDEKNTVKYKFIVPLILVLFCVSYCALLAVGRVLVMPATTSRYSTMPLLAFAGLYIAVVGAYFKTGQKFLIPSGFLGALLLLMFSIGTPLALTNGPSVRSERLMLVQVAQNYRLQNDRNLEILLPQSDYLRLALETVEKNGWSYMANRPLNLTELEEAIAPAASKEEKFYSLDRINGHEITDQISKLDIKKDGSLKFEGWLLSPGTKQLEAGVFIVIDNKIVIPAAYGISRPDIAGLLQLSSPLYSGYWAVCSAEVVKRGQHSLSLAVVSNDKKHFYQLKNICRFEVI